MYQYFITFLPLILSYITTFIFIKDYNYNNKWYNSLYKPKETPPSWVFGIVWPILYFLMGVALNQINNYDQCDIFTKMCPPLIYFFIQLILNNSWSIIFFKLKNIKLALFNIIALLFFVMKTYSEFRKYSESISDYLLPYVLWLCYATFLNYKILVLNKNRNLKTS
jgi:translocator protein